MIRIVDDGVGRNKIKQPNLKDSHTKLRQKDPRKKPRNAWSYWKEIG